MRILIIEDEIKISESLKKALVEKYYSVDIANNGKDGIFFAQTNDYDLIILDILLPDINGMEVCKELRKSKVITPILMLTALDSVDYKIKGLDEGADDYITKPFDLGELFARIRSLIRRNTNQKTSIVEIGELIIDSSERKVSRNGQDIKLSAKEFALLEYFVLNTNKVLTRDMISEHVWDMNFDPQSNLIDSFVRFLRQKIDKDFDKPYIHTLRNVGYKFSVD